MSLLKVELFTADNTQDALGDVVDAPKKWRSVFAEATYSGGSLRTYAGRLVGAHQVVLSTPWQRRIDDCRFAKFNDVLYPIEDVVMECRRGQQPQAHIIVTTIPYGS